MVVCPICNKQLKQITNTHLIKHNMSIEEFDILYPNFIVLGMGPPLQPNKALLMRLGEMVLYFVVGAVGLLLEKARRTNCAPRLGVLRRYWHAVYYLGLSRLCVPLLRCGGVIKK